MATFFADIEAALTGHIHSLNDRPAVAFPNVKFEPNGKKPYLRINVIPAETVQASLGATGKDETNGICQITCFVPAGTGRTDLPDTIADHFKRGTVLSYNGTSIRLRSPSVGPAIAEGAFYFVPVSIPYQTFTEAR
jgi:hypothetical protein